MVFSDEDSNSSSQPKSYEQVLLDYYDQISCAGIYVPSPSAPGSGISCDTSKRWDVRIRRDVLCNNVSQVNRNYPATDERSYRTAQKALQKEEEQTLKENEVDSILPNGIDK